ncbi:MAG TPA: glycoside hydrolase family 31 protein [Ohtaekwangia sp.]|uniref:glycoside hydrolase family 31 protein n=1 Tax=Ohtaekwangia sp. TaxID=2066019 RepID=UPI002F94D647
MSRTINSPLSKSLGSLAGWKQVANAIVGETSNGRFQIQFYNEGTTRISITQADTFEDFSYSVVASPAFNPVVTDNQDALEVRTSKFILRISKNPVRFGFYTLDNQPINEDDPGFGTSWNGEQVTTYKKIQAGERFIGLGEKTGPLDRKGNGYQNWNTDNFAYSPGADPLYCSIPFYMGVHNGLVYGIFFDNTHKSFFNFGASNNRFTSFSADAGEMNYYFMYGSSVAEIIQQYTHLTGRMEMPPLWSIGYQQCRYSYYPDKEVLTLAKTFREKDIPADTIVFDIHYMDQYKIFTWSQRDFSDPKELLVQLQRMGFQVVVMCDPGIKVEEGYDTYDKGIREDVFIKYQDGTNYTGQVWPGWCHFPDFTNPKTRMWWQKQFTDYVNIGVEGFWNDMNEIATWGQMIPENIELDFEGNQATMRRGRNLYGMQMARSTYEGAKNLLKGKRPFNLTRSGFSGVQRYAAVWTGDNVAYDEHMLLGVRLVNSMGLSGIAFAGYDVGGFVGDANSKLFARWVSIGAFSPFFRGHSMINSRDSEPWAYGEEVEQISRNYIKFRYQLLPYLYSLFYDASTTGMPVQRSLAIDYTHDWKIYDGQFHNQFLLGPSILVAPAESTKEFVKVYLPEGEWYSLYNGQKYPGQSEIIVECPVHRLPVFIKGGAIIPMKPVLSNTKEVSDHLTLHLYAGKQDTSFEYYEDDGSTFQYQEGRFAKRLVEYRPHERMFILNATEGTYVSPVRKLKIVWHGFDATLAEATVNGNPVAVNNDVNQFFAALEKFDPFFDPEPAPRENVHSVEIEYSTAAITLQW